MYFRFQIVSIFTQRNLLVLFLFWCCVGSGISYQFQEEVLLSKTTMSRFRNQLWHEFLQARIHTHRWIFYKNAWFSRDSWYRTRTLRVQTYSTSQQVPQWLRGFSGFGLAYFLLEDYAEAIQALSFDVFRIRGKEFKKVCEIDPECAFKALFTNDYYSFWK